ncbi:ATP-binding protein [Janthinobacterium violaceinigrum]|uniref:ATP-binding protein n=1 Tax=Janthinobacterium violaceinigrum TaxID=2654252 RepID=A0A6I1ICU1_9BURK|nr:ATP-binding protein [Janthinobacterium violaceinigrum]KAB8065227.1 ATP-binding protein [Janthinobacterium violaceinigrum]
MPNNAHSFRPKARLLVLLGDQLIGSPRLALFELVKNAYDADATHVSLTLNLEAANPSILVRDDGHGMSFEDIRDIWLVPGADHKLLAKQSNQRSKIFGRLPLGEKGLGRFAVHKLGDIIKLITRKRGEDYESVVQIDWEELSKQNFLSDAQVVIEKRSPKTFEEKTYGTRIWIGKLRQKDWTRGDVRRMYRQVTSICSPFGGPSDFEVDLKVPGREDDLAGIPSYQDILERAIWRFKFELNKDGEFSWKYEFENRLKGVKLDGRVADTHATRLLVRDNTRDLMGDSTSVRDKRILVDAAYLDGIGPISGEFYVFDRDKEVLARMPETQLIKLFLDESGGIRVYRDGVRVYNYGERGDDWLGLDLRRINVPAARISRNIVVGAVHLHQHSSNGLTEKTNREGFSDSDALERLKKVVLGAISIFEIERRADKESLRRILKSDTPEPTYSINAPIHDLRRLASTHKLSSTFEPVIARIEAEFTSFQETMLQAGLSGLGLAVVFHEIERGVRVLHSGMEKQLPIEQLKEQTQSLTKLFDGFAGLLRKNDREKIKVSTLVKRARDINLLRFSFHKINLVCPLLDGKAQDREISVSLSLVLGVLNNLLDNSFYWLRVRYPESQGETPPFKRKIFITTFESEGGGFGIAIGDNGPGFVDPPAALVQPFVTRRPEGMGLGLYYANLVMELSNGSIQFPEAADVGLPQEASGAVVALIFEEKKKGEVK